MPFKGGRKDTDFFKEPTIRGELSIDTLVFRQIERTNISASQDEALFANNVRTLMSMLPKHKRDEFDTDEKKQEYIEMVLTWKYQYWCGIPVGTIKKPINDSPRQVEEPIVDWNKLYELILDAFEEIGISWRIEKETIELGRVEEKAKPTPYYGEPNDEEEKEETPLSNVAET